MIERLFEGDRLISDGRREEIGRCLSVAIRKRLGYEEPGPDPRNPNTYFASTPQKHSLFLRRVLKTFAEDLTELKGDPDIVEDARIEIIEDAPPDHLPDFDTTAVRDDSGGVATLAPPATRAPAVPSDDEGRNT